MEYTNNADIFLQESHEEVQAIDSLREDLDSDLDFRALFDEQLSQAEEWKNTDRKYRRRLYAKLQDVYTLYVMAHRNPKRERLIERKCDELKISKTKASHLSIRIVKLILRTSDKTAYQYASALRCAALTDIACGALAAELAKRHHGIADLAARFSKEFGTKRHAADSPASGGRYSEPGDDAEGLADDARIDNDNDNGHDHDADGGLDDDHEYGDRGKDDIGSDHPDVDWGPKALSKWRKSEQDGGAWLFVKWVDMNRAKIVNRKRPR
jgi:hypothetical protein